MAEEIKFGKNEYSPYLDEVDRIKENIEREYAKIGKWMEELASRQNDFSAMTAANEAARKSGVPAPHPKEDIDRIAREIEQIRLDMDSSGRLAEAGKAYAKNLTEMDKDILQQFDQMDTGGKAN